MQNLYIVADAAKKRLKLFPFAAMRTGEIPLVFENDHWPAAPDRAFGSPQDTKIRALRVDLDETDII